MLTKIHKKSYSPIFKSCQNFRVLQGNTPKPISIDNDSMLSVGKQKVPSR
jgi:hypothetical protein